MRQIISILNFTALSEACNFPSTQKRPESSQPEALQTIKKRDT
ncbi:hypothetical protein [Mucilaginibacter ximonensis]